MDRDMGMDMDTDTDTDTDIDIDMDKDTDTDMDVGMDIDRIKCVHLKEIFFVIEKGQSEQNIPDSDSVWTLRH
jgi:hypothetical protein